MKAGATRREISPTQPLQLCGYPHVRRISTGIHDPLLVAALYLENKGQAALIVSLDLLMLNTRDARRIRRRVADATGLPEAAVLISCTHTHSAPVTVRYLPFNGDIAMPPPEPTYLALIEDRIVEAAREAREGAAPAELAWTTADGTGVGGNRHSPDGAADPEIGVLAIRTAGVLSAVAMIYSMHPTVLHEDSTLVSADFPFFARSCVPAPVVLYLTGPCGNQSPRHQVVGQTFAEAERLGRRLGTAVAATLHGLSYTDNPALDFRMQAVNLPRRALPSPTEAEALVAARRREHARLHAAGGPRAQVRTAECAVFGAEATLNLVCSDVEGMMAQILPADVQVLRIGDACVVGFPGEMFVEYALELKRRAPRRAFIAAYANGELQGYIVTPEAAATGGYEAGSSLFEPAAGGRLVETALGLIADLEEGSEGQCPA